MGGFLQCIPNKYFSVGKTNALRGKISGFQQLPDEAIREAWERFQEYIAALFNGLNTPTQNYIDAASGGSFLSLSVAAVKALVEKIASNQSWKGERC